MRVGSPREEIPVATIDGDTFFDLRSITSDVNAGFWEQGGFHLAAEAIASGNVPEISIVGLRIGPPIAEPSSVICIGQNYAKHAAESGVTTLPKQPIVFFKAPNTIVGPHDDLVLPPQASRVDWEVELGIVLGRRTSYLKSPEDAADCIAGYVLTNDVSEREYQLELSEGQWSKGKCFETFNPMGPWVLSPDEVNDPQSMGLRSWVNADVRQNSTTADMIFPIYEIIWSLSQFMVLEPGDLVNTGTPEGVALSGRFPYLADGDRLRMAIDGLGEIDQLVRNR